MGNYTEETLVGKRELLMRFEFQFGSGFAVSYRSVKYGSGTREREYLVQNRLLIT